MSIYQCWVLQVLLNHVGIVFFHDLWRFPKLIVLYVVKLWSKVILTVLKLLLFAIIRHKIVSCLRLLIIVKVWVLLIWCSIWVICRSIILLLELEILLILLLLSLKLPIKSLTHFIYLPKYMDSSTLGWGLRLANKKN
jgi:hypothetical protein